MMTINKIKQRLDEINLTIDTTRPDSTAYHNATRAELELTKALNPRSWATLATVMGRPLTSLESAKTIDAVAHGSSIALALGINPDVDLAIQLIQWRMTKGMTQEQLAQASGVSQSTIAKYERLRESPKYSLVVKMLQILGKKNYRLDLPQQSLKV